MFTTAEASAIATADNFLIFYKNGKIKIWVNCDSDNMVSLKSADFKDNVFTFVKDPASVPLLLKLVYAGNYVYTDRTIIKVPRPEPPKDVCPLGGVTLK